MFSELIAVLKSKTILTNKNVLDLRWFISNKYPDMSPKEAAKIFADSINRIIDKHLPMVNENSRPQIKTLLFEDAIKKPSFEITCADVFKCCIQTKESTDSFFIELSKWTENKTSKTISKARLTQFVRKLHLTMNDYPYKSINELISIVEKSNTGMNPFASAKFSVPTTNNKKNSVPKSTTKPTFNNNNFSGNNFTKNNNINSPLDVEETTVDHFTYNQNYSKPNATNIDNNTNGQSAFSNTGKIAPISNNNSFGSTGKNTSIGNTNNNSFSNTGKHTSLGNSTNSVGGNINDKASFNNSNNSFGNTNNKTSFNNSNNSFGTSNSQASFGNSTNSSFGRTNNKTSFNNSNNSFGTNNGQSSFGNSNNSFGTNNSQASFGNSTNSFGTSNSQASFGNSTNSFGTNNSQASFGSSNNSFNTNSQSFEKSNQGSNGSTFSQQYNQSSYGRIEANSKESTNQTESSESSLNYSEGFTHVNYNEYKPVYSFEKSSMKVFDENDENIKKKFSTFIRKVTMRKFISAVGAIALSTIFYNGAAGSSDGTSDKATLASMSDNDKVITMTSASSGKFIEDMVSHINSNSDSVNYVNTSTTDGIFGKGENHKLSPLLKRVSYTAKGNGSLDDKKIVRKVNSKISFYDLSYDSCQKTPDHPQYGITASGKRATAGKTIAAGPGLPLGTEVYIEFKLTGIPKIDAVINRLNGTYTVHDRGSAIYGSGERIDLFLGEDKAGNTTINDLCNLLGMQYATVYILE
jgi:hypothetical protein